jgi:8-oxo-dGTP pyrophosphatase MutT (NUDIX family)
MRKSGQEVFMIDNYIASRLSGRRPGIVDESAYLISAVLLPLVHEGGRDHVLFEVRSKELNRQPGEICFPGGRVENGERPDPLLAAIRETEEELGISHRSIEVLGPLDVLVTPLGTMVYPYVGRLDISQIKPSPLEVEEVFLAPIDFFLETPPYVTHVEVATRYNKDFPLEKVPPIYKEGWQARTSYPMYFYEYQDYFIWGLTCRILHNFLGICWPGHHIFKKPMKKWR